MIYDMFSFVRRRAENLVKGLLKDLDAAAMKLQEQREQDMVCILI